MQITQVDGSKILRAFNRPFKFAERVRPYGHPIVEGIVPGFPRALVKFQEQSVCELFGYQLAWLLGVRTPRIAGFSVADAIGPPIGSPPGHIGILVEHFPGWRPVPWEEAVSNDRDMTARAVALCAFDRWQWPTFGEVDGKLFFVDLETLLAKLIPDHWSERTENQIRLVIDREIESCLQTQTDELPLVLGEAEKLGVLKEVKCHLRALHPSAASDLRIKGHPWADVLSKGYRLCAELSIRNVQQAIA